MIATRAERRRANTKLLVVDRESGAVKHKVFGDLPSLLNRGDVVVINDAATLPASFTGFQERTGSEIELRLVRNEGEPAAWTAVLFGRGSWRTPTELRPAPPALEVGDVLILREGLKAEVFALSPHHSRLISVKLTSSSGKLWPELFRSGRPIQYSHLESDLHNWDIQTIFATHPVAIEAPSASFPFSWELVFALRERVSKSFISPTPLVSPILAIRS